ncbi:hypothetical protein MRB53_041841 [Persea americana]|nr:hypothetical protein MRB53_041841 [Persea americana]
MHVDCRKSCLNRSPNHNFRRRLQGSRTARQSTGVYLTFDQSPSSKQCRCCRCVVNSVRLSMLDSEFGEVRRAVTNPVQDADHAVSREPRTSVCTSILNPHRPVYCSSVIHRLNIDGEQDTQFMHVTNLHGSQS